MPYTIDVYQTGDDTPWWEAQVTFETPVYLQIRAPGDDANGARRALVSGLNHLGLASFSPDADRVYEELLNVIHDQG